MSNMSNNKKNSTTSFLGKVAIGIAGIVGGLLIGKAIDEFTKPQQVQQAQLRRKIKVDSTEYTKNIEDYDNIEQLMTCPITNCIMKKPVIVIECGHTFQKQQIYKWVESKRHCPLCNVTTSVQSLKPNYQLQQIIAEYLKKKKQQRQAQISKEKTQKQKELNKQNEQKVQQPQIKQKQANLQ